MLEQTDKNVNDPTRYDWPIHTYRETATYLVLAARNTLRVTEVRLLEAKKAKRAKNTKSFCLFALFALFASISSPT
jgi:hypothetical protein